MPKQLLEMKLFNVGTITTPDSTDIPPEAASYSLDVDSVMEDGKLKGVPSDTEVAISTFRPEDNTPNTDSIAVSDDDISGISSININGTSVILLKTTFGWQLISG
ncbi:hypothetical protein N8529_00155 [bacterium]|nr:hypothetical protein [bacterium]